MIPRATQAMLDFVIGHEILKARVSAALGVQTIQIRILFYFATSKYGPQGSATCGSCKEVSYVNRLEHQECRHLLVVE